MALIASEFTFNGTTVPYASYDSTKTTLGNLIVQNSGGTGLTNYAGPFQPAISRFFEIGISGSFPYVIDVGNGVHWVFLGGTAAAAPTRNIYLYTFNTNTQILKYIGYINLTYPTATNHTIAGLAVVRHLYTTGTVTVSGTGVTGSSTAWQTAGYAYGGARIGFGDTNPNNITNWYYISAINNDTSITLNSSGPSVSGSSFVIEELRVYTANTNATSTNGGLFVAKGVNFDMFLNAGPAAGTTLVGASSTDNTQAIYWLQDAATETNTVACGLAVSSTYSDTSHIMYVVNKDAASTLRIYKYNGRAALSGLSSGASTSAFICKTGQQTVSGTIAATSSNCLATLNHGPGQGVSCLYIPTTTRVYRVPETYIVDSSISYIADGLLEIPTGSVNTYGAGSSLFSVQYMSTIDRLVITNSLASGKQYITRYQSNALQIDKMFFITTQQLDQSAADSGLTPCLAISGTSYMFDRSGYTYMVRFSNTATSGQMYVVPLGADWDFAYSTNCRLISPALSTPNCFKYSKLYVRSNRLASSGQFITNQINIATTNTLGLMAEPFRVYYRTKGITDNSGTWILLDDSGDLSAAPPSSSIQFMFEFKTIGNFCLPAKIYGLSASYYDASTDSHFQLSTQLSNTKTKTFAWRFATAFGTTTPSLSIYLYDALTGNLLLNDNTVSQTYGTFYKSTNGGSTWASYNTTDLGNTTTYVKYVPTILGNNMTIRALLILTPT